LGTATPAPAKKNTSNNNRKKKTATRNTNHQQRWEPQGAQRPQANFVGDSFQAQTTPPTDIAELYREAQRLLIILTATNMTPAPTTTPVQQVSAAFDPSAYFS
jgi:hypothetical protein